MFHLTKMCSHAWGLGPHGPSLIRQFLLTVIFFVNVFFCSGELESEELIQRPVTQTPCAYVSDPSKTLGHQRSRELPWLARLCWEKEVNLCHCTGRGCVKACTDFSWTPSHVLFPFAYFNPYIFLQETTAVSIIAFMSPLSPSESSSLRVVLGTLDTAFQVIIFH